MPALPGLKICRPSSIDVTGTSGTIRADGGVDFSAVTALSLNNVFSSTYNNYMVVLSSDSTANDDLGLRLRVSNADNSTASSYTRQYIFANGTTVESLRSSGNQIPLFYLSNGNRVGQVAFIYGPFKTETTAFRSVMQAFFSGNVGTDDVSGVHNQTVSYDGISLLPVSGNITGTVYVYGLAK